jgi:hypothetical protein
MGTIVIPEVVEARTLIEGVLPRAWRDTRHSTGKMWFWLLSVVLTSFGAIVTSGGWQKVAAAFGLGVAPFVVSSLFHVIVTPYRQRDEARRWAKKLKAKLDEPHSRRAVELDAALIR